MRQLGDHWEWDRGYTEPGENLAGVYFQSTQAGTFRVLLFCLACLGAVQAVRQA